MVEGLRWDTFKWNSLNSGFVSHFLLKNILVVDLEVKFGSLTLMELNSMETLWIKWWNVYCFPRETSNNQKKTFLVFLWSNICFYIGIIKIYPSLINCNYIFPIFTCQILFIRQSPYCLTLRKMFSNQMVKVMLFLLALNHVF